MEGNYFRDLAPVSKELGEGYKKALDFCIGNDEVNNIAISGPYGAGKSSVLKSYKKYFSSDFNLVEISLASFKNEEKLDENKIELSILQQLIYSASSKDLPHSNFKRMKNSDKQFSKYVFLFFWAVISSFCLFYFGETFDYFFGGYSSFSFFSISFLSLLFLVTFISIGMFYFIREVHSFIYGLSVSKISFSSLEIENGKKDISFLNKNIDEFMYFFECTGTNIVVFEDLDRLGSDEVFVKLRELNHLVNSSYFVKDRNRKVKFIYALSDSVFSSTERAKFFDFILPVIPIVNSVSSFREMVDRNSYLDDNEKIDEDFLMDVSDFINDARLINNVFNEYYIYKKEIGMKGISCENLFSILLYKNYFGDDFEKLHHGYGFFKTILEGKDNLRNEIKIKINHEISEIEGEILAIENEGVKSENELVNIYMFELLKCAGSDCKYIQINNRRVDVLSVTSNQITEHLVGLREINYYNYNGSGPYSSNTSFSEIEKNIDSKYSFKERIDIIRKNKESFKRSCLDSIETFKSSLNSIDQKTLSDILSDFNQSLDEFLEKPLKDFSIKTDGENRRFMMLFRYLLLNGYLEENYNFYISIFKERDNWTESDQEYYRIVKSREQPNYSFPLDNPAEVLKRFNARDLSSPYLINISIFEFVFENLDDRYFDICVSLLEKEFKSNYCQRFMKDFLFSSELFCSILNDSFVSWPKYIDSVIESEYSISHLYAIINKLYPSNYEKFKSEKFKKSLLFVFEDILSRGRISDDGLRFIKFLDLKINSISSISDKRVSSYLSSNLLFLIDFKNIEFTLLSNGVSKENLESSTFDSLSLVNFPLKKYINDNIEAYVEHVMLLNDSNRYDSKDSVLEIISNRNISDMLALEVIRHQNCLFDSIEEIKEFLWETALSEGKVNPSWVDCYKSYISEKVNNDILISYMSNDWVVSRLQEIKFDIKSSDEDEKEKILDFKQFLMMQDDLDNETYLKLNMGLNVVWSTFVPDLSTDKKLLLASNNLVEFNEGSYEKTNYNLDLRVAFITHNSDRFEENINDYIDTIDSILALELMKSNDLIESFKLSVLRVLNVEIISSSKALVDLILPLYVKLRREDMNGEIMAYLISSSSNFILAFDLYKIYFDLNEEADSIALLSNVVKKWKEKQVMSALELFSSPIGLIANYGKRPSIPFSDINNRLVVALDEAKYVGKVDIKPTGIRVNTKKKRPE